MANRVTRSIKVKPEIWQRMKEVAVTRQVDYSQFVEQAILDKLRKMGEA